MKANPKEAVLSLVRSLAVEFACDLRDRNSCVRIGLDAKWEHSQMVRTSALCRRALSGATRAGCEKIFRRQFRAVFHDVVTGMEARRREREAATCEAVGQ